MKIFSIDPGPKQSAFVLWDKEKEIIIDKGILENYELLQKVEWIANNEAALSEKKKSIVLVIEMIACYGMPVGAEVFLTCLWIGQLIHAWKKNGEDPNLVYRLQVKSHFCHSARANDSNIRQALIDRFGEPGTKKEQGKLYGVKKDIWSALAIAVFLGDTGIKKEIKEP